MALERYGVGASYLCRKFFLIPYSLRAVFKLPFGIGRHAQQTFYMSPIKLQIEMAHMIVRWKDINESQIFCTEHFSQTLTVSN